MYLVVAKGNHEGQRIPIRVKRFLIGRNPGCSLRAASDAISREHCEIMIYEDLVLVRDLNSTNGTIVNGEEILDEPHELYAGDLLEVGPLAFTICVEYPVPASDDNATVVSGLDPTALAIVSGSAGESEPEAAADRDLQMPEEHDEATPPRVVNPVETSEPRSHKKTPPSRQPDSLPASPSAGLGTQKPPANKPVLPANQVDIGIDAPSSGTFSSQITGSGAQSSSGPPSRQAAANAPKSQGGESKILVQKNLEDLEGVSKTAQHLLMKMKPRPRPKPGDV
ncbi:cellular communication/signal transduction protein [Fimbriiglobus ruber]|uniref:Cellular communication/signal transduction protein n=1 Tax=Fimbriiglobus ruber TaxID=1908690 RepID=A0A225E1N3_9BACT|nr:cellular communication/signal transduction protein [Fimbriiglobus ruber]